MKHFDSVLRTVPDMANLNFVTSALWPHFIGHCYGHHFDIFALPLSKTTPTPKPRADFVTHIHTHHPMTARAIYSSCCKNWSKTDILFFIYLCERKWFPSVGHEVSCVLSSSQCHNVQMDLVKRRLQQDHWHVPYRPSNRRQHHLLSSENVGSPSDESNTKILTGKRQKRLILVKPCKFW